MCRIDTLMWTKRRGLILTLGLITLAATGYAQGYEFALNWRAIGTTVVYNSRAGFSSGPVAGAWFGVDGRSVEIQLRNGKLYRTEDFENWQPVATAAARAGLSAKIVNTLPEPGAKAFASPGNGYRAYAAGQWLWRSDDGGRHWTNLIAAGDTQLIGKNVQALAISPLDPDRVIAATNEGLWLSSDGGGAWISLNPGLPNLRLTRLVAAPQGGRGLVAEWENGELVEWLPGAKAAWVTRGEAATVRNPSKWVDGERPEIQLEIRVTDRAHVYRTRNGGTQWDELTSDLPAQQITGISADRASGAIYLATERGVYYTLNSLETASGPTSWIRLGGNLPKEAALDVMLNEGGNFLYVSLMGEGVFLTYAPHRRRSPALISAGDMNSRGAAPGGLMSIMGAKLTDVQLSGRKVPILSATADETQVQIPYDAEIPSPTLEVNTGSGPQRMDLELSETAPVIFTDRDGAPLLLDAESGELLDPTLALKAGMKVQILLTGLGKVEPAWPAGVPAPAQNAPKVVAPVRVWLNGVTLEVSRAELAAGYVGFYAVETKLPPVVDEGYAVLRVEASGRYSNSIRIRTALDSH
ncbi:MAG: hypothetical protein FJW36_10545 [Acidobacteria bacterium]|nr:hypothetical protein [Acidobacteriota bacterium]